ncbi:YceI family protein [Methylobacterium aerolatum]|uniref:Polyisoprenoid-binding protein YceI n=1 Tax=Methylobacterium aerolatum TaxID=418708 RepID=A0ABU0HY21_9HYPH|nr:YceI family protein [Methylobacterium aerolatum]MDQ0447211.1 polyisoprenoid-binding protein YceI [Methylobacterium aerolatum]GJD36879.1 Protein YceI [Methylobacterium aerolatum]
MRITILSLVACLLMAGPGFAEDAPGGPTQDPNQVRAGTYSLDPDHGKITWSVSHLGYSTYYGQFTGVSATLDLDPKAPAKSRLSANIPLGGVLTGSAALERHLAGPDFFDTARFPAATFTATAVEATSPTTARITGDLTLRGVTKSITLDANFNQAGVNPVDKRYTVGFDGRAIVKRSDFGINAFLPLLGDEVTLRIEGEFKAAS